MEIYLSTTCIGQNPADLKDVLRTLKKVIISGVELGSTHNPENNYDFIRKMLGDVNILTHNFFPPKNNSFILNLVSKDPRIAEESLRYIRDAIQFAASIGSKLYTFHPGFLSEPLQSSTNISENFDFVFSGEVENYEDVYARFIASVKEIIKTSQQFRVPIAIETQGSYEKAGLLFMQSPEEYVRFYHDVSPQDIGLNFNLAHTYLAAKHFQFDLKRFINQFKKHFRAVELSDNDGVLDQHRPIQTGSFVFNYLSLLPDVPWILEYRNASVEEIERSIGLIKK
ncbi:MAG: sugar phosphate isomerase/epimerase [Candidatus Omnitrophica bacterium]|nr:sugar phosphate isomerase/epimerase [Candidatus Omnitrophota bacterium]